MSAKPMKPALSPALADWRDQVMRRDLRICEWLGLAPGHVIKVLDGELNEYGEVEIRWESTSIEQPKHGKITNTGARGGWGEPTIHSGKLLLHPLDAREMLEVAGPKPQFPMSAEARATLEGLR